jgi:hypothetical protein
MGKLITTKTEQLPNVRVEPLRYRRYQTAWKRAKSAAARRGDRLVFSKWIRDALDAAADRDLAT